MGTTLKTIWEVSGFLTHKPCVTQEGTALSLQATSSLLDRDIRIPPVQINIRQPLQR
jgi:hypothetical protein